MEEEIKAALSGVRNTTSLVNKFVALVRKAEDREEYFKAFRTVYHDEPYYTDVKDSITHEICMLGMDEKLVDLL